jgi:DNA (cytosine-5)-methyltransferase 1
LFFEFARIIDAVRPGWVLVENVPGLLSSNSGRDFGVVLGTLADLGYGVGWRVLDSRFFGVPQRRRRVFIVGAKSVGDPRAAAQRAGQVLAVGSRCPGHPATRGQARTDVAGTLGGGAGERGWAQDTERMTFVAHALNNPAKNRAPDTQDYIASVAAFDSKPVRRLTPVECERLQGWPDGWTDLGGTPDGKRYAACGDGVTAHVAEWIGSRLLAHVRQETTA